MLDRAIELTSAHVLDREQFGQPLATFQGVQFQLTDAEVERSGVEELAKYALWSIAPAGPRRSTTRSRCGCRRSRRPTSCSASAHQLHGAIGFCDETTLSWLSRYSQPLRRLPLGLAGHAATPDAGRVGRRA